MAWSAVDRLLTADPLWWLRDDPAPHHLDRAVACLAEAPSVPADVRERVVHALAVALVHAEFRVDSLPALGSEAYRNWFVRHGRVLPGATRILGALFAGDDETRKLLDHEDDSPELVETVADYWTSAPGLPAWLFERARAGAPGVRAAALRALARHWPHDDDVRLHLHEALSADSEIVRLAALAHSEDRSAIESLATTDPKAAVRRQALERLATRRPDDPRTWTLLHARAVLDPHVEPRLYAVRTIARCRPAEPSTEALLTGRVRAEPDSLVGTAAAQLLRAPRGGSAEPPEHYGGDPRDTLEDDTRRDADALATIRGVLRDRWLGPIAIAALASRWPDDPATIPTLTALTGDVCADVRHAALTALALRPPGDDLRRLLLERSATDPYAGVRTLAIQVLASLWPDAPETLTTLRAHAGSNVVARQLLSASSLRTRKFVPATETAAG